MSFDANKYSGNPPSISRRTREKIALVIMILLSILGFAVVLWFLSTANFFNVYATKVDDKAGTMEHYTTVVYSGIRVPDEIDDSAERSTRSHDLDLENIPKRGDFVYASDIRLAYEEKNSDVMTLDIASVEGSETPAIYEVSSKKIAFFSATSYMTKRQLDEIVDNLRSNKVDVIVCVTPRSLMLGTFDGIDCVLCTEEKSPSETSEERIGNCLIARAAEFGSVGVLNITSSNLVSDKIYSSN